MTKTVKELEKELKIARNAERNSVKITKNKNFDYVGPDPDSGTKESPASSEVPDFIGKPTTKTSKRLPDSLPY